MSFKAWANVYSEFRGALGSIHATREIADQQAARGRLACVEIKVVEGMGLVEADQDKGEKL